MEQTWNRSKMVLNWVDNNFILQPEFLCTHGPLCRRVRLIIPIRHTAEDVGKTELVWNFEKKVTTCAHFAIQKKG